MAGMYKDNVSIVYTVIYVVEYYTLYRNDDVRRCVCCNLFLYSVRRLTYGVLFFCLLAHDASLNY